MFAHLKFLTCSLAVCLIFVEPASVPAGTTSKSQVARSQPPVGAREKKKKPAGKPADGKEPADRKKPSKAKPPVPETGEPVPGLEEIDRVMQSFIAKHEIPGAGVAIVKDGRLIYSRGFGYSDVRRKQPVQPDSLFRIASISKPITAVAILRLVERKQLSLDDKVLDVLTYKPHLPEGAKADERWKEITVRQLLQHTGGWDRGKSFDAMFKAVPFAEELKTPPPAKPEDVIRVMLGKPLDFDPGTDYAYSNFGYCLLGRIIEKKTGKTYEQFVKDDVLKPIGVTRMQVGRTLRDGRVEGEVRYYVPGNRRGRSVFAANLGRRVPRQYGCWHLEAMDSHGGWIASAEDLCRFAAAIDRPRKSKILKASSIKEMFAPPPPPVWRTKDGKLKSDYYAFGWSVKPNGDGRFTTQHTGSLDGTSTLLVRRHDGIDVAVLFNTRTTPHGTHPARMIDPLMNKALNGIKNWPEKRNLFENEK